MSRFLIRTFAAALLCAAPALADDNETLQIEADDHFAAAEWAPAIEAYERLLENDDANADNWFQLARAYHETDAGKKSISAYKKALEQETTFRRRAYFHLARAYMTAGEPELALGALEDLGQLGGVSYRTLEGTAQFAGLADDARYQAVLTQLRPCSSPEHRHFDFWLGEWNVSAVGSPGTTAFNKISSVQDGCAILEEYSVGQGGFAGMSISFYNPVTGKWHQAWMSNSGGAVQLEGGLDADGAMVMTDENLGVSEASGTVNRVTWTPLEDGRVRQHWQSRPRESGEWTTVFDGYYALSSDSSAYP